jgi:hypothetical protein
LIKSAILHQPSTNRSACEIEIRARRIELIGALWLGSSFE